MTLNMQSALGLVVLILIAWLLGGARKKGALKTIAVGVALQFVLAIVLLLISINTLATYFIDSGIVTFIERPELASLLSAVNIGLAALLKIGYSWCPDARAEHLYFRWTWIAGLATGVLWIVMFSAIFPRLGTESLDEFLTQLERDTSTRDAIFEGLFVGSQLISEICIAAAFWIQLERMVKEHAPPIIVRPNPEFVAYSRQLDHWKSQLHQVEQKRCALEGRLEEFRALEASILQRAVAILASRRNGNGP